MKLITADEAREELNRIAPELLMESIKRDDKIIEQIIAKLIKSLKDGNTQLYVDCLVSERVKKIVEGLGYKVELKPHPTFWNLNQTRVSWEKDAA